MFKTTTPQSILGGQVTRQMCFLQRPTLPRDRPNLKREASLGMFYVRLPQMLKRLTLFKETSCSVILRSRPWTQGNTITSMLTTKLSITWINLWMHPQMKKQAKCHKIKNSAINMKPRVEKGQIRPDPVSPRLLIVKPHLALMTRCSRGTLGN